MQLLLSWTGESGALHIDPGITTLTPGGDCERERVIERERTTIMTFVCFITLEPRLE